MKKIIALLSLAAALFSLGACSRKPDAPRGIWDGEVYSNPAVGISFTLPVGFFAATEDGLRELGTPYDFVISQPESAAEENPFYPYPHFAMYYEKVDGRSPERYIAALTVALKSVDGITYITMGQTERFTLAEKTWYRIQYSAYNEGGIIFQDYFVRKINDGFFACIVITYSGETTKSAAYGFINRIEAIK